MYSILDITMPNLNGIETARELLKRGPGREGHHAEPCTAPKPWWRRRWQPARGAI